MTLLQDEPAPAPAASPGRYTPGRVWLAAALAVTAIWGVKAAQTPFSKPPAAEDYGRFSAAYAFEPSFAADGTIRYGVVTDDGARQLRRVAADGSGDTLVADLGKAGVTPVVSPDGRRIAYVAGNELNEDAGVYVAEADGTGARRLARLAAIRGEVEATPAFSPDGRQIAYVDLQGDAGNFHVLVMGVDGSAPQRVTPADGSGDSPAFSPDGKRLAYVSMGDIHVVDLATGRDRELTTHPDGGRDAEPAFSPDGKRIVFLSRSWHSENDEVVLMNADGSGARRLTPADLDVDRDPVFSPDGKRIAWVSNRGGGRGEVWLMNTDGRNARKVTDVTRMVEDR